MKTLKDLKLSVFLIVLLIPVVISSFWCGIYYSVSPTPSFQPTVKVMTYNIHEGVSVDNKLDLEGIAATVRQGDPDILILQEVDQGCAMTGYVDEAKWLTLNLNMYCIYAPTTDQMWQGDIILSKYPIVEWNITLLPSPHEVDVLVKAVLNVNGQSLTVFGVHFTVTSPENREIQIERALDVIEETSGLVILAGDFNIDAYATDLTDQANLDAIKAKLEDSFDLCPSESLVGNYTFSSWAPYERIDYIFVSTGIKIFQHRTISSQASDHLPVLAEIQLPIS
jgi:endonuclease/exonuclease/phosphatase family metal-dependent hydrolase